MAGEYDMGRMQEDAARRAREMQARARFPTPSRPRTAPERREEPPPSHVSPEPEPHAAHQEPPPPQAEEPAAPAENIEEASSGGMLESLFKDKEKTIILALLILLGSEGGNHELMFALMFLLM